jgi:hypothetical protein
MLIQTQKLQTPQRPDADGAIGGTKNVWYPTTGCLSHHAGTGVGDEGVRRLEILAQKRLDTRSKLVAEGFVFGTESDLANL